MTKASQGRLKRRQAGRKFTPTQIIETPMRGRRLIGTSVENELEIPVDQVGYPGSPSELHVVACFEGAKSSDQSRLYDNAERDFEVAALLSKSPNPTNGLDFRFTEADGSSYFILASPEMRVDTAWGAVLVKRNARAEASFVTMQCRASTARAAYERLHLACSSFLDHWAYEGIAPTYMTIARARDAKNQVETVWFVNPFRSSLINPSVNEIPTPLRPILALYREALCSTSPLYRFLCFYKILEGYFDRLKPDLAKLLRESDKRYPMPSDLVPDHPDLAAEFKGYVGKSITTFRQDILKSKYRTAVAHFAEDGSNPIVASNPLEIVRFSQIAFVVELCARTVIDSYRQAFRKVMAEGVDISSLAERTIN